MKRTIIMIGLILATIFVLLPNSNAFSVFGLCLWDCKISTQATTITENYNGIESNLIDKTEENKLINSTFIDYVKEGTDSFYQNTKYIKFPKNSIFIDSFDGEKVKFSIDFTKGGWKGDHWEYKAKIQGLSQISPYKYKIGNKYLIFNRERDLITYSELGVKKFRYLADKVNVTFRKGELLIESSIDYYDPSFQNSIITDYINWYNFSSTTGSVWTDEGSSLNLAQSTSQLRDNETSCVNGNCIYTNSITTRASKIVDNSTGFIAVQVNWDNIASHNWQSFFGIMENDIFEIRFDGTSNVDCTLGESAGDHYIQILASGSKVKNTDYVFMCMYNSTTVCVGLDNSTNLNCEARNGNVDFYGQNKGFGIGHTSHSLASSGGVYYDRFLNVSERQELYNCLSTRGNIDEGCTVGGEPPAGDTCDYDTGDFIIDCSENCTVDAPYSLGGNDIRITGSGKININADITDCGNKLIRGTDSSNKCYVKTNSARFC